MHVNTKSLVLPNKLLIFEYNMYFPNNSKVLSKNIIENSNPSLSHLYNDKVLNTNNKNLNLIINLESNIIIVYKSKGYIYNHKYNKINSFPNPIENHEGGSLVYCSYDKKLYLISGINCSKVESIYYDYLNKPEDYSKLKWSISKNDFNEMRSNFCCFVVNTKFIYVILGFNNNTKLFSNTVNKLDVTSSEGWIQISTKFFIDIKSNSLNNTNAIYNIPNLINAAIIEYKTDSVLILGGNKQNQKLNKDIYLFNFETYEWTITKYSFMKDYKIKDINKNTLIADKNCDSKDIDTYKYKNYNDKLEKNIEPSGLFMSSCRFIPMKFNQQSINSYYFSLFDSNNYCHLLNIRTFDNLIFFSKQYNENNFLDLKNKNSNLSIKNNNNINNITNENKNNESIKIINLKQNISQESIEDESLNISNKTQINNVLYLSYN